MLYFNVLLWLLHTLPVLLARINFFTSQQFSAFDVQSYILKVLQIMLGQFQRNEVMVSFAIWHMICTILAFTEEEEKKASGSQGTPGAPDTFTTTGSWSQDPLKSTMWLGTEDGW